MVATVPYAIYFSTIHDLQSAAKNLERKIKSCYLNNYIL
jgi:hypothetical protein